MYTVLSGIDKLRQRVDLNEIFIGILLDKPNFDSQCLKGFGLRHTKLFTIVELYEPRFKSISRVREDLSVSFVRGDFPEALWYSYEEWCSLLGFECFKKEASLAVLDLLEELEY